MNARAPTRLAPVLGQGDAIIRQPGVARIARAIAGYAVVTCDIFDTAVMRRLARPEDVYLATGARGVASDLVRCSATAFREYRIGAEHAARAEVMRDGRAEVTIAAVYQRLQANGVVSDAGAAAALEFAVERAVCRPVPDVRAALASRRPGQRLIFVSDSTLPAAWLATILEDCGYGEQPEVICSAAVGHTKAGGGLFAHVLAALGCAGRDVVHLGDNPHADIVQARQHGIAAIRVPHPPIPPEPENIATRAWVVRLAHSQRRSRAGRAAAELSNTELAVLDTDLQRMCLFPLIGFTLFVLDEARRRGIRRIYFTARDGYLPMAIAQRLVARSGEDFAFTYLQCSRQAVLVPTLADELPRLAALIADATASRPLHGALNVLGFDADATSTMARAIGLDPNLPVRGKPGRLAVQQLLESHRAQVIDALQEQRAAALGYLRETGFLAPGPRMVVDVGWRGSVQQALTKLSDAPRDDIFGCYVGLWADAMRDGLGLGNAAGYLFSFGHPKQFADIVRQGYILFELFFSAPHGSVSHYAWRDGRAVPVHADESDAGGAIRRAAFAAIERRCLGEFDELDTLLGGAWPEAIDAASALTDIEPLLVRPSSREVATVNRIPYIHGIDSAITSPTVNPVPWRGMLRNFPRAIERISNAPWRSGTLRASLPWPLPTVGFPEFADRAARLRRWFRRA